MILICGTVPMEKYPLTLGEVKLAGDQLVVSDSIEFPCTQGTAALISAAYVTSAYTNTEPPRALLIGDRGEGKGSRILYKTIIERIADLSPEVLILHYMLPIMGLMKKVYESVAKCSNRPVLIADASSMYAAKAAGLAPGFDIFTPDLCELAFLADSDATHPAYVSRHLFEADIMQAPDLIEAAYHHKNAAKLLVVKGATDYIATEGRIIETITTPDIPSLEAIGGTGDTISGMIGAFIDAGFTQVDAARIAVRANRLAGQYTQATPSTKIRQIIMRLPDVFSNLLNNQYKKETVYDRNRCTGSKLPYTSCEDAKSH